MAKERTVVDSILDSGEGSDDSLLVSQCSSSAMSGGAYSGVGDVELLVLAAMSAVCTSGNVGTVSWGYVEVDLRNVEVDSDQDSLALEVEVGDGELGGEGHCGDFPCLEDECSSWEVWKGNVGKEDDGQGDE